MVERDFSMSELHFVQEVAKELQERIRNYFCSDTEG